MLRSARSPHRFAAIALVLTALVASLLGSAVVPGAQAASIAMSTAGFTAGPVLAPDGRVIVGEHLGNGALRVLSVKPGTAGAAQLLAFGPLPGPRDYALLDLDASGATVTGTHSSFRYVGAREVFIGRKLTSRVFTLAPRLESLGSCAPASQLDVLAAAGDGFVATVGADCSPDRTTLRIRTAQGTHVIRAELGPGDRTDFTPHISDMRASGPALAWVEMRLPVSGPGPTFTLVVARGATGEVLLRTQLHDFVYAMGLGVDGTVVLPSLADCSIGVVSPAAPVLRRIALPAGLCPQPSGASVVAGGRILYPTAGGYASTDGQGAAHFLRDSAGIRSQLAFDGTTGYATRLDCDADRLVSVDPDAAGTPPGLPLPTLRSCPVRRSGTPRARLTPTGRVGIRLRCPAGCRGTLRLVQQRRGGRERRVASISYAEAAGTFVLRPRIAAYARALAGCSGGLRVNAVLFPASDDRTVAAPGKGLGAYRISSRSRCRRTGGPAFTAPAPGPRP